jgi:hypothetical protein
MTEQTKPAARWVEEFSAACHKRIGKEEFRELELLIEKSLQKRRTLAAARWLAVLVRLKSGGVVTPAPKGFLIDLLMPPDRAEDALFNILRRYDYWVEKHGAVRARCIFVTQSLGAVLSFWTDWLLKRAKLLRFLRPS